MQLLSVILNTQITPFSTFCITFHIFVTGGDEDFVGMCTAASARQTMTNHSSKGRGQVT